MTAPTTLRRSRKAAGQREEAAVRIPAEEENEAAPIVVALALVTPGLSADTRRIEVDDKADFAAFKTFVLREGRASSRKPEINSALTLKTIEDAIRAELTARG